jgi:hypothetical protein
MQPRDEKESRNAGQLGPLRCEFNDDKKESAIRWRTTPSVGKRMNSKSSICATF